MNTMPHLAIDIGASGGRLCLGWLENDKICLEEVHRFPNGMTQRGGNLCWDVDAIFDEILAGMKKCARLNKHPISVGVDTWGVDFVLLDPKGNRIGPTVAYRDNRTDGIDADVYECVAETELYARTGIQKQLFNTVYQLMAIKKKTPQLLHETAHMLMMPDYLYYRLCGAMKTEYTNATTTGLVNAYSRSWDAEIINRCGFPRRIFGEIVSPGTVMSGLTEEVKRIIGYDCTVVMAPTHDTASAFLAVPAKSDNSVYISSGTWSLMGVELASPITSETSRTANFTNEGGYGHCFRFLKNIMGLWILQSVHRELKERVSITDLMAFARTSDYNGIIDVDEERFFAPFNMSAAITESFRERGQAEPQSPGDLVRCICRSLAVSYARTVGELEVLTGKRFDSINIVGGGSKNGFLNEITAAVCGVPVFAGPTEATALGNIISQMIAYGELPGQKAAREVIAQSFDVRCFGQLRSLNGQ